jgi:hypothetical protein
VVALPGTRQGGPPVSRAGAPAVRQLPEVSRRPHPPVGSRNFQARWLAVPPAAETLTMWGPPAIPVSDPADPGLGERELARGALATLDRCVLVGTAERLADFVEALTRLVGRPMPPPLRLNSTPQREDMPPAYAEQVRARSQVDIQLHRAAGEALDRALGSLPPLPRAPETELPYEHEMSDAFCGTGWHARLHTAEAGWHRWTGPGTRSELRLPVRIAGPAHIAVAPSPSRRP